MHMDFKLSGNEYQDTFNDEKYIAIAYQQPKGIKCQRLVEERWHEWCTIVEKAPWRPYWRKSKYSKQICVSPNKKEYVNYTCGTIPLAIYSCAVWGFGIEGWLKKQGREARTPVYDILNLQGTQDPKLINRRTHMWDDKLLRGCGLQLPSELGDLDRWLEKLWQQVCADEERIKAEQRKQRILAGS